MIPLLGSTILLAGLLSVSIPIIIHLLHRQKTIPMKWGAMIFLKESPLQMKRRKQVDHLLLLLLRMAALALLAWLIAWPRVNSTKYLPGGGNQSVDVAVVIDHSLSMGRHHGDKTLLDDARGMVDRLIDPQQPVLHGGDTISVVLAEHRPRKFTDAPLHANNTGMMTQLHNELHALKPGTTDCTIPEAIEAAREVLSHGPNVRKILLVASDEQKANWNIGDYAAWQRALGDDGAAGLDHRVEIHSYPLTPDESVSNVSIEGVTVSPSTVAINHPVQIAAKVSNSGPKEVTALAIRFSINGKQEGEAQVIPTLAAGQSITVRFDHTFTNVGSTKIRIWTDVDDALAADNEAYAAVYVWEKLPVLVLDGQLDTVGDYKTSRFLNLAMQPVDPDHPTPTLIQTRTVAVGAWDAAHVNLDDYFVLVLNDVEKVPDSLQAKLADYVRMGHGLWVIMGQRSDGKFLASLGRKAIDGDHVIFTADLKQPVPHNEEKAPATVQIKDLNNPMVQLVAAGQPNALSGAIAQKWWSMNVPREQGSQVILATTSGDPLIVGGALGSGQYVIWTTSVDGNWNNWHMMPNFTPLVNETIYQLASPMTHQRNSGCLDIKDPITWAGPLTPAVQSVDVTLPDGSVDKGHSAPPRDGRHQFTYTNNFVPGLYQLNFSPSEIEQPIYYAVGIDRRELEPARLSAEDHTWLKTGSFLDKANPIVEPSQLTSVITRIDAGSDIWVIVACFVIGTLVLETFMTYRMVNLQKGVDVLGSGVFRS